MRARTAFLAVAALCVCASQGAHPPPAAHPRLLHIKGQILAKLGLSSPPQPVGAPPRDVVRQILARAARADPPPPPPRAHPDHRAEEMREVIAIAHRDKCSIACKGSSGSPAFLNGHKYNYGVEGTVSVFLTTADKQETSVKLLGQVGVSALGNCGHELTVQNLVISGPDGKKYNSPPGIEKPIRFSLENGRLGAEICAEDGDTRRSLNIKRAIISLLQTEQKPTTQVDVFGACPTEVSSSQEGAALLVHRSRDLSRCAHREQGKHELIAGVFNPTAEIKNTQILQSTLHAESKVNNGVPEKVVATEEYLYKPFSVGENGARAKVLTKLTLTGKVKADDKPSKCIHSRTVIFENPHGVTSEHNADSAINAVKETAKTLATEASSKSAGNFAQLVRILRTINKEDLSKIYNSVKGNSLEKRVFLDGLLRAGTGYSIEASIDILKSKELSSLEQQLVLLSLGNARHVNNEALKAASSLLDLPELPKETYLGVGALAGVYCREHFCHDGKSDGIVALSQKLASKLNCKAKSKVEEDTVIAVLKGIRNIRHLENSLIDKLIHCASDNSVKARVKVAALEAFHADPCASKLKKTALDLLKNHQLDSEIRIKAYLAVIECPCAKSATEIKNVLDSEPVHQVGRFITTSLVHIRASANPDKHLARQHYGQIRSPNKFNIDDRKYSFYRELSYNIDALGLGGNAEQTVIYSQDSFLPRSASLNLTAELFGHNVNILEIGGRQGNLDRVVEHFLGPKGVFRSQTPQAIYDQLVKRYQESSKKVQDGLSRGRRSVKSEIDNFDKHLKDESVPYNNELDLDINMKLFGTEAVFLSLGDDQGFDFNKLIDKAVHSLNNGLDKAKNLQHEVRAHLLFLDAELAYPTSTGLPLKLDLIGSATARLELATSIDIRQFFKSSLNTKLDVKLVPSTDIEVAGLFAIDADSVATGLKVVTNLHSSTGGHLIAKLLDNHRGEVGFDLQFQLPIEKQEILTASSDLLFITAEKGQKEKQIALKSDAQKKEYSGCFDQLAGVLGLTVCGELSVPPSIAGLEAQKDISKLLARYPLSGSSKLKLVIEKSDLRGYHVKGSFKGDKERNARSFELLFEAEGTKNRRTQLTGEFVHNKQETTAKLALDSPIKTLSGHVSLLNKPTELIALVEAQVDKAKYSAKAGFSVQGNDQRKVYKPVIEYQLPDEHGKQSLKVDGQLIAEQNGPVNKYSLEGIKITIPNSNEVVTVDGHFSKEPKGVEIDVKAKKGEHNLVLVGSLKGPELKLEFQNTLNPFVNFRVNGHFENNDVYHNDIDLYYGGDLKDSKSRVSFNQLLKYHKQPDSIILTTKNKFEIYALPLKVKFDADIDSKKVDIEIEGQYTDKKADFDLEARINNKKQGDYSVKISAEFDKKGIEALAKRDVVSNEKSNFENYILIKNLGKYELSGVVLHKNKPNDINLGAVGHLKISGGGKNEDIKFDVGVLENANKYSSHAKISGSKGDLLDYILKITRGANPSGELKFNLKDTIATNGNFKVIDNDGKGHGSIIIDFKKADRKIKGDIKFVVKDPVYSGDVDLFLNFDKDKNDKIHFSTNTKKTDKLIDSKNKLEYAGKKTELNVHNDGLYTRDGKTHGQVEVVLPNERCLTFKLNRDMTYKDDVANGNAEIILTDAVKRGGESSSISYKGKVINTNIDKDIIDYEGQINIKLKDGKDLQNTFSLKHVPQGDKAKIDFKSDLKGSLLPKPASLLASVDYSGLDTIDGTESYRLKGNFGDDIGLELVGNSDLKVLGKGEKKYHEDYTLNVRLPFEKAHDIKFVSNFLYVQPENKEVFAECSIIESVQINADLYKVDASGKVGAKTGFGKVKIIVPHVDPLILEGSYKTDLESAKKSGSVEVKTQYGKGKTATIIVDTGVAQSDFTLVVKALAPQAEKLKKLEVNWHAKNPNPGTFSSLLIVDADGRVYKSDSLVVYSKSHPVIDLKYSSPSLPKPSRLFLKGDALSSTQGKVELKIDNIRDISLDAVTEANIHKDNIVLKLAANSEKLNLKNYKVDISSKDVGSAKRLEFHAVNDNKNLLSGSTSFISKQEGPKTIIEGSGSVKVKDEQKSANFKYIRTVLTEGNEQGVETFLNLAIGDRSYVAESRVTNLEYKNSIVYCEEKKQCAHLDINSKLNVNTAGVIQHLVNVGVDLRKLGFAPEFGLQVSNEVSDKKLPQYSLDLHVNKDEKKYYLHVYSAPAHGKFPAGITITLPQRVLALESLITYPTDKALPFPLKGEASLHLDKNKPQLKTAVRFLLDVTATGDRQAAHAEIGLSHPKLGKEALIKVRGNLARPDQKSLNIETSASLSHPTLGSDREAKLLLNVAPAHIKLLVDTPLVKVIDLEGSGSIKEDIQQADLKFSLLQGKPVQVKALIKEYQYFEFSTSYSDEKERKLSVIGHINPEKRVDISADIILPGQKKNILNGALFLQDNLLKSEYGVSKDNINYFVDALQKDLSTLESRIKNLGEKASADFKNTLHKVEPTLKKLEESYTEEIKKLYNEVANDQALKEISEALHSVVHFFAKLVDEVVTVGKPFIDKICATVKETCKKICDLYEKQIEPQLKQLYTNISALVKEYLSGVIDVVAHFSALVTDFLEKHKPELKELTNTIAEIFKDLTKILVSQLKEFRERFGDLFVNLSKQIKELPIVEFIKEKWQEFSVPEQALGLLQEAHNTLKTLLPTDETRAFVDALYSYVNKKLRQEKVDDSKELRVIYEKLAVCVTSLVQFIRGHLNQLGVPSLLNISALPFLSSPGQVSAPSFTGGISISLINQLLRGDLPDPVALLKGYRPRSLNPLEEVPSKLRAVVVNGQHMFTFDGRHLTFPGSCRYVLAHDFVDRNFTLALQLQAGAPKSLLLEDKSGAVVEIKDNGQVLLNNAAHGFPVIEQDIFAFKQPNGRIGLGTKYGLKVFCTAKFEVCYVEVSGFYLGKLRGLLGDGNNEPYDDFRLPNGKVVSSEAEFGHAHRLSPSCPPPAVPAHPRSQLHAPLPPPCEKTLGAASTLRPLAPLLDVLPFRQACIHAVSGDTPADLSQACALAGGYAALAVTGALPAIVPPVCLSCEGAKAPGDQYEVTLPGKDADIVIAVETTVSNEKSYKSLVVPLVSQLVDSLKSKKISDIRVHLVGITPSIPYPIIYDTDLKLKNAKIQFTDKSRYSQPQHVHTGVDTLDKLQHTLVEAISTLQIKLGVSNVISGYNSVLELPLRASAVKHVISVVGEKCHAPLTLVEAIRTISYDVFFSQNAFSHSLVTVTPDIKLGGGKDPANIVGFTDHSVFLLGDKKKGKESDALRPTLELPYEDACIEFTQSSDGLVLSATTYLAMNPQQQKQYLQTAAGAITQHLLQDTWVQSCACVYVDPFRVQSVCYNKDKKEAARSRK